MTPIKEIHFICNYQVSQEDAENLDLFANYCVILALSVTQVSSWLCINEWINQWKFR